MGSNIHGFEPVYGRLKHLYRWFCYAELVGIKDQFRMKSERFRQGIEKPPKQFRRIELCIRDDAHRHLFIVAGGKEFL